MVWIPPSYFPPDIQSTTIRYEWDDWDSYNTHHPIDQELRERLAKLPTRAILAYTIAVAEWIVYRFLPLLDNPIASDYLEANWAQVVNWRYADDWDVWAEEDEWVGPVKRPISEALVRIMIAIQQAIEGGDLAWRAAHVTKIAEYVLPRAQEFTSWRDQVVDRLESLYAGKLLAIGGNVVPREAFDVRSDFDPVETEVLVNQYLRGLDYHTNTFLSSPDQMRESGFVGTPYVFSSEEDLKIGWQR
jgi:hypothetical protein